MIYYLFHFYLTVCVTIFSTFLILESSLARDSKVVDKILFNNKKIEDLTGISQDPPVSKWVKNFCSKRGNEYYIEVPLSFFHDPVVLNSINILYDSPYIDEAIKLMIDQSFPENYTKARYRSLELVTIELYNVFHSRYILTWDGLSAIKLKYNDGTYGNCPRYYCNSQHLLPIGLDDEIGKSTVKCFCPSCHNIFHSYPVIYRKIDGMAFGTTLPHLLFMQYPEMKVKKNNISYAPKIFGFNIKE